MKRCLLLLLPLCFLFACGGTGYDDEEDTDHTSSHSHTSTDPTKRLGISSGNSDPDVEKTSYDGETVDGELIRADAATIELVFCLDATGSMKGLIKTAKEKIWDIVTSLTTATPAPNIRLGMIFYRDKGEDFVTESYSLTYDIDAVYAEMLSIKAKGGGDTPESVNQALYEAVTEMPWSEGPDVYKTVFVVGDCQPHMDYDEVQYPETCELAKEKGIVLNTIKLGYSCRPAIKHFEAIAACGLGEYQQLDQDAEDYVIVTPYDDSINYYAKLIDLSKIYYGTQSEQSKMNSRKSKALGFYSDASSSANSSRAAYNSTSSGTSNWFGKKELLQDIIEGRVDLNDIDYDYLPPELQEMKNKEREKYVRAQVATRRKNMQTLKTLTEQREAYIEKEIETSPEKNSFSRKVFKTILHQALEKGVELRK